MQFNIKATNVELSDKIKDYAQKKMDKLEKYLGKIQVINAAMELEMTTKHHSKGDIYRTQIDLELPQELLTVEKTEEELFKAIDKAEDHMAEMIKKYKEKRQDRQRQAGEEE